MAAMSDRFIVAESSGYTISANANASRTPNSRLITEVMVLDRGYCHRVVWSSLSTLMTARYRCFTASHKGGPKRWVDKENVVTARRWPLVKRRRYAADLAARLNAEDDE
jgi:hypothetical protein